ncbi:MAG: hypothetical protein K2P93_04620 [Alphaproteobacteria bacterium]|nr:hypothetical protein [Alphaproteobacteria bacterium]
MRMKLLVVFFMTIYFATFAYGNGINYKLLESTIDDYCGRVTRKEPIEKETIKSRLSSLTIIRKLDEVDRKYTNSNAFSSFYEALMERSSDNSLRVFAATCNTVYGEYEGNPAKQITTHLLLEAV